MRVLVGALIVAGVLFVLPGYNPITGFFLGLLTLVLLRLLGPRSMAEKTGAALAAGLMCWLAGARVAAHDALSAHFLGWAVAGGALAYYLHPKSE